MTAKFGLAAALLAASLADCDEVGTVNTNAISSNGLECKVVVETSDGKEDPQIVQYRFLSDGKVDFGYWFWPWSSPLKITNTKYIINHVEIDRTTGYLSTLPLSWWAELLGLRQMTGTCHAIHIAAKM